MFDQMQYDAWMMSLSEYFMKHYAYHIVAMPKNSKELWLVNSKRQTNRIIMISSMPVDQFDSESIEKHRSVLAQVYQIDPQGINISVNQAMVETDDFNVIVGPGNTSVSPHLKEFKNIAMVLKVSNDSKKAVTRSMRSLSRQVQRARQKTARKLMPITTAVTTLCVALFFAMTLFMQVQGKPLSTASVMFGAYYKPLIVAGNEWFRLLTAGFLHADIFHLLMNLFALNMIARVAEPVLGKRKFLTLLLSGVIAGNVFVFIRNDASIGLGLSGGIFALMGWLVIYLFESGAFQNKKLRNEILYTLLLNAMISMMPGISFMAHLGGFVTGIFFAVIVSKHKDWKLNRQAALAMTLIMVLSMGYLMINNRQYIKSPALEKDLIETWQKVGIDSYADRISELLN